MAVTLWGPSPMLAIFTDITSTFSSGGTKVVISARRPKKVEVRLVLCHMSPAVRVLLSWAGVKRSASCRADTPVADQQPFSVTHQKFRVLRLAWRSSTLTGSSRKVS